MKRLCAVLLTALLCVCLCASALSEASATLVASFNGVPKVIVGTNRFDNYYVLTDVFLEELTERRYYSFSHQKGWITACDDFVEDDINYHGVFDMDGNIIVPFVYGKLNMCSHDWIVGIKLTKCTANNYDYSYNNQKDFYLISSVDVYYTPIGKVATLTRDQYNDAKANTGHLAVQDRSTGIITLYDSSFSAVETLSTLLAPPKNALDKINVFKQGGSYGLKDDKGNIIAEPIYRYIYTFEDYPDYAVYENEIINGVRRKGLLSTADGSVVVPDIYDDIKTSFKVPVNQLGSNRGYNARGYFAVVLDNKLGFVDLNGNETLAPKYSKDRAELNGASYSLIDLTGDTLIVAADGVETLVSGYKNVTALDYCSGMFYQVETNDRKFGVIDWHGNEILPVAYEQPMKTTADGKYVVAAFNYDSSELYELIYPDSPEMVETEEPAQQSPETEKTEQPAQQSPETEKTEQPTEQQQTVPSENPVVTLIDNAVQLMQSDAAANSVAAATLLGSAKILLGETNSNVTALIDSAVTLINADAAANASSIITLLETAKGML